MKLFRIIIPLAVLVVVTGCTPYACPSYPSYAYGSDRPNYETLRKKQAKAKRPKSRKPVRRAEE